MTTEYRALFDARGSRQVVPWEMAFASAAAA